MSLAPDVARTLFFPVLPLVFAWPVWVPTLAWLAYGSLRPSAAGGQVPRALWLLLLAPVSVALWAALGAGLGEGRGAPAWPFWVLHALALGQVSLGLTALHRYREAGAYAWPAALANRAYTAVAWFFGAMALENRWL